MGQIVPAGQLNIAALSADDLYISIVNPPPYIRGVPTDVFGVVGTASWGKANTPIHMGSGQDAAQQFGPISAVSLTDPYDLATDLYLAFQQASSAASIEGFGVRVTDGTDTAATNFLPGASADTETCTVGGTITAADVCTLTITDSSLTGSPFHLAYTVGGSDTTTTIAAALAALVNANATLAAAYITATVAASVVTVYYPSTATVTFSESVTGSATESLTLAAGAGTTHGVVLTAVCTGILGNQLVATPQAGSGSSTYSVTLQNFTSNPEVFTNIPLAGFWTALANAINNGQSNVRGPSQYFKASNPVPAVGAPTLSAVTLAGGTDGRTGVVTANLLGNSSANPPTGLYALSQLNPQVGVVWITGCTDNSIVSDEVAFNQQQGCSSLFPFPTGTSTATAVTAVSTNGAHDPSLAYVKDSIYFFDPINGTTRLVLPTAVIAGTIVSFSPEQSPGNKPVSGIIGTERNNPVSGNQPYQPSEVAQLENAGIMFIANPIPAGSEFGIRHGQTTSLQPATAPFEYWRMTAYLARSFSATMGQFVDQLQSQQPQDPLRNQVKLELNNFLQELQGLGQIDGYQVNCNFSNSPSAQPGLGMNTPASIAQHYLYVLVQVTYLSSVRFFILSLQGGTTVVTSNA